jgi:mutator protein MutT
VEYHLLGQTGIKVSEIGFGTIPILHGPVSILPPYYNMSEKDALYIMEKAIVEYGYNLFDTAIVPEYGDAEIKLGKLIKKYNDKIVISDKARAYTNKSIESSLFESLRNLGNDYCDIYFIHQVAPENESSVYEYNGALDMLCKLKKKGYIRAVGIATHHYDIAYKAVNDDRVDVIQIPGNILERGILDRAENTLCFQKKGVIIHKANAAGVLTDYFSMKELLGFLLTYNFINSILLGMGSIGHIVAATSYQKYKLDRISFNEVFQKLKLSNKIIPCDRCQKCRCPSDIEISTLFRYYNYYYLGHRSWAENKIRGIGIDIFEKCYHCNKSDCEILCPKHISIKANISRIFNEFIGGAKEMSTEIVSALKVGRDYIGVGVGAIILRNDNILLLLRKKAPEAGSWTIPGGRVEFGETVEQAILREVKEEIGVEGRVIAPLGVTDHILTEEHSHWVSPRFLIEVIGEPQNMEPQSHEEMRWFPISELPDNVTLTTQKALAAFLTWNKGK